MSEKYLNKNVIIYEKDGKKTIGIILYWVKEMGEREFVIIEQSCIYVDDIERIELIG